MKTVIRVVTWLAAIFLILLILFFLLRQSVLDKAVEKVIKKAHDKNGLILSIESSRFESFFNVGFRNVSAASPAGDTIVHVDSVFVSPRIFSLLRSDVEFSHLDVFRPALKIYRTKDRDNISFLFKNEKEVKDTLPEGGMPAALKRLTSFFFGQIPDQMRVKDLSLHLEIEKEKLSVRVPDSNILNDSLTAEIELIGDTLKAKYQFIGSVDRSEHQISGTFFSRSKEVIPFLKENYNLALKADTLKFSFEEYEKDNSFAVKGVLEAKGFFAENWRIAPEPVVVPDAMLEYDIIVSGDSVILDSTSKVRISGISISPYLSVKTGKHKIYTLDLKIPEMKADTFFSSLPDGIFEHTKGIRASGFLNYNLHFRYDEEKLDSLQFSSKLNKRDLKILSYGRTDLRKMNGEFTYSAFEKGRIVRSFPVGPSHPSFTPIESISPYLLNAVMTSEDGNFYYHGGFNEDAFRKSIIENIREKRFKRGGSTISMQLVKNVFLTRNKNVSRKVEEALITWLIENNRIVSKQRMLEVYMNIIEWGPGVYGIGEASGFYFEKSPATLDLNESIFLAMIVPQPKGFRYHFDEYGHLKPHCKAYFDLLARHLVKKNIITEDQQLNLVADVKVTGPALSLMKLLPDSLKEPEEIELRELELKSE